MQVTSVSSKDGVVIRTEAGSYVFLTRKEITQAAEKFTILDNLDSFSAFPTRTVNGHAGECLVEMFIKSKEEKDK